MSQQMNPVVKEDWAAALRSGKYQQGRLALRSAEDRMCCLGVLCQLHSEQTGTPWGGLQRESGAHGVAYLGRVTHPPREVLAWAGLDWYSPAVEVDGRRIPLVDLNDGWGSHAPSDFNALADLIEAQL